MDKIRRLVSLPPERLRGQIRRVCFDKKRGVGDHPGDFMEPVAFLKVTGPAIDIWNPISRTCSAISPVTGKAVKNPLIYA